MPTSVVGAIKLLDTTTPGTSSFVRFWLRGARGNEPRITATGAIAPQAAGSSFYVDLVANSSGVVSGSIYSTRDANGTGNGDIEAGGSYVAVWYGMQVYNSGIPGPEVPVHAKQGVTLDISTVIPILPLPVVVAPAGDVIYARLDGANTPFTAPITFGSSTKFTGVNGSDSSNAEGSFNYRTDLHRPRFYDGTLWRSVPGLDTADTLSNKTLTGVGNGNSVTLLNAQSSGNQITGTSSDAILYTYTMPASTVANLKGFRLSAVFNHSLGSANVSYLASLNGVGLYNPSNTGGGVQGFQITVLRDGSTTGTLGGFSWGGLQSFVPGGALTGLAWGSSQVLNLTFNVANTNGVTPIQWLVELVQ